jgi:RNA polymerase sigma factor (sigma-70 family)
MAVDVEVSQLRVQRRARSRTVEPRHCGSAPSNAELLTGCRIGDAESWDELVVRYQRLVYAVPLREGLSAADAAEISQSTFEALIESLDRIRDPDRIGYWLMTVARRLTWRRRTANRAELSIGDAPLDDVVDDQSGDWVRSVAVYDAVAQLAEPCRALIFGLFFDPAEPSYEELSRSLDVAIGSIGPMRGRCLERLRDRLEA